MVIRLLGTGAAEGIPAFYSETPISEYARQHGGKDVRSRAAALVDGCLKIDMGPDTLSQIQRLGLDARDWTGVFFTHSDADHFAVDELQYLLFPFSDLSCAPLTVYGNRRILDTIESVYPDWPFDVEETKSFQSVRHCGYVITPVRARHAHNEDAHNLLISDGSRNFLYATDTGYYAEPTWEYLKSVQLDALVIECTEGFLPTSYDGHLDVKQCLDVIQRLRQQGTLHEGSRVVTTHHSHNGGATHAQLEEAFASHAVEVGFDGMSIEI